MKWRLAIRLEIGLDVKAELEKDVTEDVTVEPMDEEEEISEEASFPSPHSPRTNPSQLKKLHEARTNRQKKERKRVNEKKARDLLKLQLNMTAPEDLDIEDRALGGEDEMFDLGEGEKEMARTGRVTALGDAVEDQDGMDADEEEVAKSDEEEEFLDSEEEQEAKLKGLEGELDHLYDEYKERMSERDAKYKVKMARMKDRNFDAWHGIQEGQGSGDEDGVDKGYRDGMVRVPARGARDAADDGDESEEGGWDVVADSKARVGEAESSDDSSDDVGEAESSDDSSDDEDEARPIKTAKKQAKPAKAPTAGPSTTIGTTKLVTSLQDPQKRAQMSRQAQIWFDQSVFKDVGDLAALDEDEEDEEAEESVDDEEHEEEEEDVDMASVAEDGDVEMEDASEASSTLDEEPMTDDDDFEVVPQEKDDGAAWDVDDEDQDEVKKAYVKGM
jgi:AdoMet-dependent rRNA methyltransferase SPB1